MYVIRLLIILVYFINITNINYILSTTMFFGKILRQGERFVFNEESVPGSHQVLSISNIALAPSSKKGASLFIKKDGQQFLVAILTLKRPHTYTNIILTREDSAQLVVEGAGIIHVIGFFEPDTRNNMRDVRQNGVEEDSQQQEQLEEEDNQSQEQQQQPKQARQAQDQQRNSLTVENKESALNEHDYMDYKMEEEDGHADIRDNKDGQADQNNQNNQDQKEEKDEEDYVKVAPSPHKMKLQNNNKPKKRQKKLVLSEDLQRALWAQGFINLILSDPPSFEEIKEQSLHSRLLNMEWPYPELAEEYEISKEIEKEMKRFFMPKVGVYFPNQVFNQQRFDRGRSQQYYMTFYPTYTTTHQMFKHIKKFQTTLLYGKWGIGKSQSIILYCRLSIYVNFYFFKYPITSMEFKKFYRLLETKKPIYWTISQNETMDNLLKKVCYQKPWLWKKDENLKVEKGDYQIFLKIYQQNKKALQLEALTDFAGIAFFDQINAVASIKRRVIHLEKQKKKMQQKLKTQEGKVGIITEQLIKQKEGMLEKLKKQSSNLNDLMEKVQATSTTCFYNSSSNIEISLLTDKQADERTMNLYSIQHGRTKPTSFKYQAQVSREKGNVGMLELAQFFTNIMQEFTSFSKEVVRQWESKSTESTNAKEQFLAEIQEEFINTEWNSIPNAVLIVQIFQEKQLQHHFFKRIAQCKNVQALKQVILMAISTLNDNSKETLKTKLNNFLEKSGNLDANFKRKTKIYIYQKALKASLRYENLPKEQQPLSFEFSIKVDSRCPNLADNIDKQIFTIEKMQNNQIFDVVCSISPTAYSEIIIETAMTKYTCVVNEMINLKIFKKLVDKSNRKLGQIFDQMVVKLFDSKARIDLCIKAKNIDNQEYEQRVKLYEVHKIKNFEKVQDHQKSSSSFADKFRQVFQQSAKYPGWKVCKPNQFQQLGQKKGNNYAFDLVCIKGQQKFNFIFVDFTLSMVQEVLDNKILKFVQMLSQQEEFQPLIDPPSALGKDEKKMLDQYKGRISFVVLSLEGKNEYLTKDQVKNLFKNSKKLGKLALKLQVKFIKCYLSNEALQKAENVISLEKDEKKILKLNAIYRMAVENRKNSSWNKSSQKTN